MAKFALRIFWTYAKNYPMDAALIDSYYLDFEKPSIRDSLPAKPSKTFQGLVKRTCLFIKL